MKAVGYFQSLPINNEESLIDFTIENPVPKGHDLLISIQAISVNPVDTKIRNSKKAEGSEPMIIGWDASGIVEAVGEDCTLFQPGDEVYYAGDITRAGTYSEYHLVDERIVGKKPSSLSFEEAAALPLTTITAWEALFERMRIPQIPTGDQSPAILIIGGAGGVGSIAIQLAKWAGLTVISTASRKETTDWVKELGADHVINHHESIPTQLKNIGFDHIPYILCLNSTDTHWEAMSEAIEAEGTICSIVETDQPLSLNPLKDKSVTFTWEFMFTRAKHQTPTMIKQHELLNSVASLVDKGKIRTTLKQLLSPINAEQLKKAHTAIEEGSTIGKIVLKDF
ncbi:zinc-binding alcohol dehydrogenase family protein [Jeotgalibacillus soli]|uniref:Zinc-type alcohol dehydrogenase-like protein n=1 Tax=Jeotgalibacillus soli TaxID=889306 RepID=A0A0C2RYA4_9BACL|nr:zinc-binding alcohol dehydrogenase family protein [Jeotgalibacillus soli]KIL46779.1 zinc-binding alcohol dehydrogenase [Jeotgalibacillus soli]